MQVLPTKRQWKIWSLPSKLTAIGAYVGVISLVLALAFWLIDHGGVFTFFATDRSSADSARMLDSHLFAKGNLLPVAYASAKPGMRLSLLRASFPAGEVKGNHFVIRVSGGPFTQLTCGLGLTQEMDPQVGYVTYAIRNSSAFERVRSELLVKLDDQKIIPTNLGQTLRWENVNGMDAELTQEFYTVKVHP